MTPYDPEEARRIVEEALGILEKKHSREALSLTDSSLLESLYPILHKYVPHGQDISLIFDEIRKEVLSSFGREEDTTQRVKQLHTVVKNCQKCPRVIREPHLPVWNNIDPDVLFVLESPIGQKDSYLIEAMKEAGFSSSRVGATSVIRCNMQQGEKISSEEISNCSSNFLFEEIKLLSPKLIVPLGKIASSTILGTNTEMKSARGNVFWLGIWQIMPAMSPRQVDYMPKFYDDFLTDIKSAYNITYKQRHKKNDQET